MQNRMELTFLSRAQNEAFARVAIAAFVVQLNPTLPEMADIKTAVSEAVTNAIVHGYPEHMGDILLKVKLLSGNVIEITVRDQGRGIPDVEQARTPMFTTGGEERSGMGFTIMESFMTTFSVISTPGKGTTVHMRRKLQRRK